MQPVTNRVVGQAGVDELLSGAARVLRAIGEPVELHQGDAGNLRRGVERDRVLERSLGLGVLVGPHLDEPELEPGPLVLRIRSHGAPERHLGERELVPCGAQLPELEQGRGVVRVVPHSPREDFLGPPVGGPIGLGAMTPGREPRAGTQPDPPEELVGPQCLDERGQPLAAGDVGVRWIVDPHHRDHDVGAVPCQALLEVADDDVGGDGGNAPVDDAERDPLPPRVQAALELARVGVLAAEGGRRLADAEDAIGVPLVQRELVPSLLHGEEDEPGNPQANF